MKQIIYSSAATTPFSEEELHQLLEKARIRNSVYGITGMLLYHTGSFLQVLEGDAHYVDLIFRSIAFDPRHVNLKQLHSGPIQKREFEEWSMAFTDTSRSNAQPTGLVDYFQLQPLLTLNEESARKYLYFFYLGLYRQLPATGQSFLEKYC